MNVTFRFERIFDESEIGTAKLALFKEPIEFTLNDGTKFKLTSLEIRGSNIIKKRINTQGWVELKFCLSLEEDLSPETDNEELWRIILFPMRDKYNDEIPHGVIIDHSDSAINGNLQICGGTHAMVQSNHVLLEYRSIQDDVLTTVQNIVKQIYCEES